MRYRVKLEQTDEGYSVWCPALPGCWSQGATEDDANRNIKDAITEYVKAAEEVFADKATLVVDIPA